MQDNGKLTAAKPASRHPSPNTRHPKESGGRYPLCKLGKGLSARLMEITPQVAQMWLDKTPAFQRNTTEVSIESIARLILADKWELNGQTIVINRKGQCINGRHRLAAFVKTNKACWSIVVYGIDDEAYKTMDAGRVRHSADALKTAGYKSTTGLAAAAHVLWLYEQHDKVRPDSSNMKITPIETVELVAARPDLPEAYLRALLSFHICKSHAVPTFCNFILHKINADACEKFFHALVTGEELTKGDPVLELRRRLLADGMTSRRQKIENHELIHLIFKSWNLVRKGQTIDRLMVGPNEELPRPI